MAQARQRQVDLTLRDEADDEAAKLPVVFGRITITWYDYDGAIIPDITFDPLGRINPNTLERCLPHIYREMQRAQVASRSGTPVVKPVAYQAMVAQAIGPIQPVETNNE